jgi:hypothetical protein
LKSSSILDRATRVTMMVMLAWFLFSSYRILQRAWELKQTTPREGNWVVQYEQRFDSVKPMLPSRGVIPYLTDLPPGTDEGTLIPQYALAPRLLDRNAPQRTGEIVLANYSNPALLPSASTSRLRLVADFGNGVKAFRVE